MLRQKVRTDVEVITAESPTQPDVPVVGIELGTGYRYEPEISFDFGQRIGGPSAGLVFALAIYDKITDGPLLNGRHLAGTGSITPTGSVGGIGGIQEKIAAAEKAGATAFLVPAANCDDLDGVRTDLTLIRVATLSEAIAAVETLNTSGGAGTDAAVLITIPRIRWRGHWWLTDRAIGDHSPRGTAPARRVVGEVPRQCLSFEEMWVE